MNRHVFASIAGRALGACVLLALGPGTGAQTQGSAPGASVDAAALYHDYCSVCHGDRGDGDSRAKNSMRPPPRDFTAAAAREMSRETMIAAVAAGKPGTAMAPWGQQLGAEQIAAVVDYIRDTFMASSQAAGEGARLYARTCSVCHGDSGNGASWATANLNPRPRDFTSPSAAVELTRDRMLHSVTFGRPDTAMPGFGTQLDEGQIAAVVDFIRSSFMRPGLAAAAAPASARPQAEAKSADKTHRHDDGSRHDHNAGLGPRGADTSAPFAGGLLGNLERGQSLYRDNCVACHGEQGNGQGPRAYFILPKPRNFTHPGARSALNRPHLYSAIARGKVGTEMPAWDTVLDAQSIADIAEYVFQRFILGEAAGAAGAASAVADRR
jgi:mono/diheme cytochrome c family protein